MEVKPGYKLTEVGVIPEDWVIKPLGSLASLYQPTTISAKEFTESGFPVYGANGIVGFYDKCNHETWQVTVTCRGSTCGTVNRTVDRCWITGNAMVLNCDQNASLSKEFFYHLLCKQDLSDCITGTGQPQIVRTPLAAFCVPLPPTKAEQEAIAGALSEADGLVEALAQLLAKKRHLKQAALHQLLTPPGAGQAAQTRLPGFTGQWDAQTIEGLEKAKLLRLSRGNVISKKDIEQTPGDNPIYSSSVTGSGAFGYYGKFMFDEELITWSIDGGGHFFHRPRHKFSVTNVCGYMRVDSSKLCCAFVAAQLQLLHSRQSYDYQTKAHPSVIRKAYTLRLPSLPEQAAIAGVLSAMDGELGALEAKLAKARQVKQGLMQELLTGRTRLV
jgi:type I restriction enzyme S subunit